MSFIDDLKRARFEHKMKREIERMQNKTQKLYKKSLEHVSDKDLEKWNAVDTTDESTADEFSKLEELVKAMKKVNDEQE